MHLIHWSLILEVKGDMKAYKNDIQQIQTEDTPVLLHSV